MSDHIVRATAEGVRAFAAITTDLVAAAAKRHECFPVATAALGRVLTGAVLFAANLKNDESVTIRIAGDGELGDIVADANSCGAVRGYVHNPHADLPAIDGKLSVGTAVGKGLLQITRFTNLKEPFTGTTQLVSGEIGEDLTRYLLESEQTPSTIGLGVLVNPDGSVAGAAGFMVQAMPGADPRVLEEIEKNLVFLSSPSQLAAEGVNASGIIRLLFTGLDASLQAPEPLCFQCNCGTERVKKLLAGLSRKDLEEMIQDDGAEVKCHFCAEYYQIPVEELKQILNDLMNSKK